MALTMSDAEVARQYRAAADKRKALDIIAELNGNPGKPGRDEVTAALARQGIDVKRPYKKLDQGRVQALYDQGYSDQEIARTVGAEQDTVKAWRKRNNLRTNKPMTEPEPQAEPLELTPERCAEVAREAYEDGAFPPVYDDIEALLLMAECYENAKVRESLAIAIHELLDEHIRQRLRIE